MKAEVETRYKRNLERVDNLVQFYEEAVGPGSGRTTVANTDLLRSAVVFLHATLEEVLRSVLAARWRLARDPELFERVPFIVGTSRKPKITVGELAAQFGGRTVDEVLQDMVDRYLEKLQLQRRGGDLSRTETGAARVSRYC